MSANKLIKSLRSHVILSEVEEPAPSEVEGTPMATTLRARHHECARLLVLLCYKVNTAFY